MSLNLLCQLLSVARPQSDQSDAISTIFSAYVSAERNGAEVSIKTF
jgi:hypothetical protein